MVIRLNWKKLLISIAVSLGVGALAAVLTNSSMEIFKNLEKPMLAPPGWLFPVVWTILYILMGISAYLVGTSDAPREKKRNALIVYSAQLVLNFIWPIIFFNFQAYLAAFVCLVILWALILTMIIMFSKISPVAAWLQVPYLLWVTFAGYLNLSIYLLNR